MVIEKEFVIRLSAFSTHDQIRHNLHDGTFCDLTIASSPGSFPLSTLYKKEPGYEANLTKGSNTMSFACNKTWIRKPICFELDLTWLTKTTTEVMLLHLDTPQLVIERAVLQTVGITVHVCLCTTYVGIRLLLRHTGIYMVPTCSNKM